MAYFIKCNSERRLRIVVFKEIDNQDDMTLNQDGLLGAEQVLPNRFEFLFVSVNVHMGHFHTLLATLYLHTCAISSHYVIFLSKTYKYSKIA